LLKYAATLEVPAGEDDGSGIVNCISASRLPTQR
jgi:hypothetical protein